MGLFIQTNVSSMIAQSNLNKTSSGLSENFNKLSSGFRINGAADDAAGLGISKIQNAAVRSVMVASRNASDAISMAQTADGASEEIHNLLTRMRELAVQASNGTNNTTDLANLDGEFASASAEITRIGNVTTFNGTALLTGTASVAFQVGIQNTGDDRITVSFGGASASNLGITSASLASVTAAQTAIATMDSAISSLSTVRRNFGSTINRLQSTVQNLSATGTNLSAALSRLRDTDIAMETASLARSQVLTQAGAAVLGQANQAPQLALSLLRG
jgi:flagellin